ncbi:MAG: alpha-ketoglutarate-dependent dioxygenase AlkB family protein [Akkermansiaceae bacterium]
MPSTNLLPCDGEVFYQSEFFSVREADDFLAALLKTIAWEHDEVMMFGKKIITARKVAWYGDASLAYRYSGKTRVAIEWTRELRAMKEIIERSTGASFNSCLLNLYADGDQGMGWHSDDEKELGRDPEIASVSLGAKRRFDFRNKDSGEKVSVMLEHGSLLAMKGRTQTHWQHQIPKTKKVKELRVNLTFRQILK